MEEIRTGLENQERKIVNYLFRKKYDAKIILKTCKDSTLGLNPKSVKTAIRGYEKRKNNLRKTLVSIIMASSLGFGLPTYQQPQNYEEDVQEAELEIRYIPSECIEEDSLRFYFDRDNLTDKEYSDEEMKERIEDYLEYFEKIKN